MIAERDYRFSIWIGKFYLSPIIIDFPDFFNAIYFLHFFFLFLRSLFNLVPISGGPSGTRYISIALHADSVDLRSASFFPPLISSLATRIKRLATRRGSRGG